MSTPTDICNDALDAIGSQTIIGDIEEGTREAQVCLRAYARCRQQLLRSAHWQFARKSMPMVLLADATGQTPNVGTLVPVAGMIYEYEYPIDCMKVIFVPANPQVNPGAPAGNIATPNAPLMTGLSQNFQAWVRPRPTRFLVATDPNYPPDPGQDWQGVQGVSPAGRTVILSNMKNASVVYTTDVIYPSVWDSLFRQSMVAYLAQQIALAVIKDQRQAKIVRDAQIEIVRKTIEHARAADGNEAWISSDLRVDWMEFRNAGTGWGVNGPWGNNGIDGVPWGSFDVLPLANGSAF